MTVEKLLERFNKEFVTHRNFSWCERSIFNHLTLLLPGEVLTVVGPSRVGKTSAVKAALMNAFGAGAFEPEGPCVWIIDGNNREGGWFSTRAFYIEGCSAAGHPIYGVPADDETGLGAAFNARISRTPEAVFRSAFERCLITRKVRYLVIDEAHHVMHTRGGDAASARILDSWKCLAEKTGVVLILIGTYQLLYLTSLAPHLIGRQTVVEFRNYRVGEEGDVAAFQAVLSYYSKWVPTEPGSESLRPWGRLLFEGSLGCVGLLSRWLRRALAYGAINNKRYISEAGLTATKEIPLHYQALRDDIDFGDELMRGSSDTEMHPRTTYTASRPSGTRPSRGQGGKLTRPFVRACKRTPNDARS